MNDERIWQIANRKEDAKSRIAACRIHAQDFFKSTFLYNEDAARSAMDVLNAIFKELDALDARITNIELTSEIGSPLKLLGAAYRAARGK